MATTRGTVTNKKSSRSTASDAGHEGPKTSLEIVRSAVGATHGRTGQRGRPRPVGRPARECATFQTMWRTPPAILTPLIGIWLRCVAGGCAPLLCARRASRFWDVGMRARIPLRPGCQFVRGQLANEWPHDSSTLPTPETLHSFPLTPQPRSHMAIGPQGQRYLETHATQESGNVVRRLR